MAKKLAMKLRRSISMLLAVFMLVSVITPVNVSAAPVEPSVPAESCEVCGGFVDVDADLWYHDAIDYMIENELMNGVSDTEFAPGNALTRGMFVTILFRMSGAEAVEADINFDDVAAGRYYVEPIKWAVANEIVNGYGNGKFGPDDNITREQIATILFRYTGAEAVETELTFDDAAAVSTYAVEAMQWAVAEGLFVGDDKNMLNPGADATRAQAAQVLVRFIEGGEEEPDVPVEPADVIDLDAIESLPYDCSQAAQLPLTGYMTKAIGEGRTAKVYISENASIRSYFTIVAVPDGVDTKEFLETEGWIDIAEAEGECLFILEPGAEGWGSAKDEAAYVDAAIGFLRNPVNDNKVTLFSTFGEFYVVGYGAGAPAVERWVASNPILAIAQVYMDAEGLEAAYLNELGAPVYYGSKAEGSGRETADEIFELVGGNLLKRSEVPVPAWFINYGADSVAYWQAANDVVAAGVYDDEALGKVYPQDIASDAYATLYANTRLAAAGEEYGLSKVAVLETEEAVAAEDLYAFMSYYTRYDTTMAYSNALGLRLEYSDAIIAAQTDAKDGEVKEVVGGYDIWALESTIVPQTGATMYAGIGAFADNSRDEDPAEDPREFLLYVPESAQAAGHEAPVIFVWPGNSQTDIIFTDATLWWQIAEEEGVIIAMVCETYSSNSVSVSHADNNDMYAMIKAVLAEKLDGQIADIDFTRLYSTGQSAGSAATQTFAQTYPEFFAAVASTSAGSLNKAAVYEPIPSYMLHGLGDGNGGYIIFEEENTLRPLANYYLSVNGLGSLDDFTAEETQYSYDFLEGEYIYDAGRYADTYDFAGDDGISLVRYTRTSMRPHNCYPEEMWLMWDFMKNFSFEVAADGTVTRYYSESAFEANDKIQILDTTIADLDDVVVLPYDCSEAAQLPLTGYFTKTVAEGRTVKVYISEDASVRSYFTVVAVPDGVDTTEFLEAEGWFDVADEKGEGLFVMEPGAEGWGTVAEELSYVTAAMNFFKSGSNANKVTCFSVFGEFYFVGYGAACAPLEAYAAEYPIFVISQAYFEGEGAGQRYLDANGAETYDGKNTGGYDPIPSYKEDLAALGLDVISKSEVPVPTWFAGYADSDYSIGYWKAANDVVATPEMGVYRQDINSDAMQTNYANKLLKAEGSEYGISEVIVNDDVDADAAAIYAWLSTFTRYDNTFAYSNALGYRLDYTAATVEAQQAFKAVEEPELMEYTKTGGEKGVAELYSQASVEVGNGEVVVGIMAFADNNRDGEDSSYDPREYLMYIPESAEANAPVVMVYPGNSQTDRIFMDATMWWPVADEEGFVLVFICETYSSNSVSVSHADSDLFYYALKALMTSDAFEEEYITIDPTRIYATGQSAGSMTTQGFARTNPEFFAAVASTSGGSTGEVAGYIPSYLIIGQSDLGMLMPDMWGNASVQSWAEGLFEANGMDTDINSWTSANTEGRFHTYVWENAQGIPMVQYGETQMRTHNCYPEEMQLMWDYMKHFKAETDENGYVTARYYSPSAFTSSRNDAKLIVDPAPAANAAAELKAQVESIQAYTMPNFYGQRLYKIEVTFAEGTDMAAAANAGLYRVWDRAFSNGAWEQGDIDDVTVEGNVVTLHFDQDPANNAPFGMLCTMNWSIKTVYNEAGEITGYAVATSADQKLGKEQDPSGSTGKDFLYFTRENLDLVVDISTLPKQENGLALTDGFGNFNEDGVWKETVDEIYDDYELALVDAVEGDEMRYTKFGGKVPVHYQVPESYDPEVGMPLVLYVTGNGTSYWEGFDQYGNLVSNNEGTNITYDNSTAAWIGLGNVIVGSPDVHSDNNTWAGAEVANAIKYFQENYNITKVIIMGNSNGTGICSQTVRDFPELVDVFLCYNGWIGNGPNQNCLNWTAEQKQGIAEEGVAIWVFQGETDPLANPNQGLRSYNDLVPYYQAAGWSDEWIADNFRVSGFKSYKFQEWGVNDHSCVKMASWNYITTPYLDVYEGEAPLAVGEVYHLANARDQLVRDFEYVTYAESISEWALGDHSESAIDLDAVASLPYDCSQAAQLPLTGYMTKAIGDRTAKVYISENASIRSYFTIVAVPDGVDTYKFLKQSGWLDIAEAEGECLFVLEPGAEGWGTAAEEAEYVDAAIGFLRNPVNGNRVTLFSTFGEFYVVGYGAGAPAVERWVASNPILAIAQVYMDAEGLDAEYLEELGAPVYYGSKAEGSGRETAEEIFELVGGKLLKRSEVPVPAWFINYGEDSVAYWQAANDVIAANVYEDEALGNVYPQNIESTAYATRYANTRLAAAGEKNGLAKVAVLEAEAEVAAEDLYAFLSYYTRYDTTMAYSNALGLRLEYSDAIMAAQNNAKDGEVEFTVGGYDIWALESTIVPQTGATMYAGISAFADNSRDEDPGLDPREFLIYVPESAQKEGFEAPVIFVWPGNSQTDIIFTDATLWWQIAEEEGLIVAMICETYSSNSVSVSHADNNDMYAMVKAVLAEKLDGDIADIDFTRLYSTGQSAGSSATQTFAQTHPEFYAAVASTSAASLNGGRVYEPIPSYVLHGLGDGNGGYHLFEEANGLRGVVNYYLDVNGLGSLDDYTQEGTTYSYDFLEGEYIYDAARYTDTFDFATEDGISLVRYTRTSMRPHNCYPEEMWLMWDFVKNFSFEVAEDGEVTRYYSASAFAEDDKVEILKDAKDFDEITKMTTDYSEAAQLPLTGYFTKAIGTDRSVKVYIAEDASIRSYFTVIAVPNGVDTKDFLEAEGWFDVADAKGEGLFILEPGEGGWGTQAEEAAYVTAAINFLKSPSNAKRQTVFSTFGEHYFVGYGEGCAPLEGWVADNPIFAISQVYIGGETAGEAYLDAVGAKGYDNTNTSGYDAAIEDMDETMEAHGWKYITRSEVPVPTWFAGYAANDYSVSYWKAANDVIPTTEKGVYRQDINSDAWQTAYANEYLVEEGSKYGISQVKVSDDTAIDAEEIYAWLATYTRYDNTFAYSNALGYRLDYSAATVEAQQAAKKATEYETLTYTKTGGATGTVELWSQADVEVGKGEMIVGVMAFADNNKDGKFDPREYLIYVPDSAKEMYGEEGAPVVIVYPGMSQTDRIFMDSTMWWNVADANGFVVAIECETYSNATAVNHKDNDLYYYSLREVLKQIISEEYVKIDTTRMYATGQSAGSGATQGFARTNPEFFAAVASSSMSSASACKGYIPAYLITGQSDLGNLLPDLWGSTGVQNWAKGLFEINGLDTDIYSWSSANTEGRHQTYTWNNAQDIPMVQYGKTLVRAHNCYPAEMWLMWDFMEHYSSVTDENGYVTARYYSESAFAEDDAIEIENPAATEAVAEELKANVESIQAYTMPNFYGQRLYQIEITYAEGTDMEAAANADFYGVWDRAFNDGAWEQGDIDDVTVEGNVVTLHFDQDPANNAPFGMLCTMNWSVKTVYDEAGEITGYAVANKNDQKLGKEQDKSGSTGKDFLYFTRENLDLVVDISRDPAQAEGLALTDGFGNKLEDSVWLDTVDEIYDDYELALVDAVEGDEMRYTKFGGKVPVHYQVPESYDPEVGMPLVLYVTGNGTSYWEGFDEYGNLVSNNEGTNITYDNSTAAWIELGTVIVGSPDVHSDNNTWAGAEVANAINWFKANYNITKVIIMGNSNGTGICSQTVRDFPELVDVFLCYNGWIGNGPNQNCLNWTAEQKQGIAEEGVAIWVFQGETDPLANPNQGLRSYNDLVPYYQAAGWSDKWIADNFRVSGFKSYKFQEWGVNDHSCVKMASWNYITTPYLDVYEGEAPLAVGEVYHLENARDQLVRNFEYVTYAESISEWALGDHEDSMINIDTITSVPKVFNEAAQLPLTGYFFKEVAEGRDVKVYISEDASIRSYFTVVAVPDGVDTEEFLEAEGWFDVADEKGEGLFIMEPGEGGWGTMEEELSYVTAAMNFFKSGRNAKGTTCFSVFGEFYFVGYGAACAPLEAYAAEYPIFVISQVYIDGEGAGQTYLDATGAKEYDNRNTSGYDPEIENFDETLAALGWDYITRSEVPVPTWFAGYAENDYSIAYWKAANDVVATTEKGVYRQDINSKALQTTYANDCLKAEGADYGIAEVVVNNDVEADAAAIYAWLATFTRYDNTFAYSNALGYRLDYTAATVEAQQAAKAATEYGTLEYTKTGGEKGTAELWSQASVEVGNGEMIVGVMAFADNTNDGKDDSFDPREYIVYVPESAKTGKAVPVVMVYPGNSQTDRIFMDSTMWWKVADDEGFVVAIICETYNSNAVSVSHYDSDLFYYALTALLTGEDFANDYGVEIDETRIYGTGQSAGSNATQGFARTNPEFFAAVASTSFANTAEAKGYIPVYLISGQSDLANIVPDLWTAPTLQSWAEGLFEVNGLDTDIYSWTSSNTEGRFHVYSWENEQGIEMVKWGQTQSRAHNCYPAEMPLLYDYMKHFSVETDEVGNVVARYYSESAFELDDAVMIQNPEYALQEEVVSIQATTAPNFYGHKVETVVIEFAEDVDVEALEEATFTLYDRGFQAPNFGKVEIVKTEVEGNVVTLTIDQGTDKTADRSRDTFGTLCTSSNWFIDSEGNIYGKTAGVDELGMTINRNSIGKGLQRRNLDLILCINNENIEAGIMSTDGVGNMLDDTVWQETILGGGLAEVERMLIKLDFEGQDVDASNVGKDYTMMGDNEEVPVDVIWPEGCDGVECACEEEHPVIFYQCGGGVCYWENTTDALLAPANNRGCNVVYDNMMTEWHKLIPEAIIISVNVHSSNTSNAALEIIGVLEYFVENYNADVDKIVGVGNSQGTIITSDVIRQRADLIAAYIPCNGDFGGMANSKDMNETLANSTMKSWTEEEVQAVIDNEVALWMNNGETDGNNPAGAQDITAILSAMHAEEGKSEEWIFNHIRLSGYQSWKFKEWGETDHSVTKMVAWFYLANAYNDVHEGQPELPAGAKYKFAGNEEGFANYPYTLDFEYTVYEESIAEWVKNLWAGQYE